MNAVKYKFCEAEEKPSKKELLGSNDFVGKTHQHIKETAATPELFFATIAFAPLFAHCCFSHLDCISRLMLHISVRSLPVLLLSFNMYLYLVHSVIQSDMGLIPRNGLHYCAIVSWALPDLKFLLLTAFGAVLLFLF